MACAILPLSDPKKDQQNKSTHVIVGGGIAGVSCAEMLSVLCPNESILLISASPTIKAVTNISHLTKLIATFDIEEQTGEDFESRHSGVQGKELYTHAYPPLNRYTRSQINLLT